MMFTMRAMKTHPSAQPLGFFDVELRVQWLEVKGNPLSRLDSVIDNRIYLRCIVRRSRKAGGAIRLINLIYPRHGRGPATNPDSESGLPSRSCGTA